MIIPIRYNSKPIATIVDSIQSRLQLKFDKAPIQFKVETFQRRPQIQPPTKSRNKVLDFNRTFCCSIRRLLILFKLHLKLILFYAQSKQPWELSIFLSDLDSRRTPILYDSLFEFEILRFSFQFKFVNTREERIGLEY